MIASVAKALNILNLFSTTTPRLTLTTISQHLGMPKSTTHHLVSTLVQHGYLEKQEDDTYALGRSIIALTQSVLVNVELRDRAAPLLRKLADACNESVYLTVRDHVRVLYIYAIESSQRLLARTAVGDYAPLYCTAVGKAVLSFLTPEELTTVFEHYPEGFPPHTPYTITHIAQLKEQLDATYKRGYSIDNQEHELNTYCIGAPIFDARNAVIGACSISGTDPEIIGSRLPELTRNVLHSTQEISRRMGYVPARMANVRHSTLVKS